MTRRIIKLDNGSGTLYPLNGENNVWIIDATGFGVEFSDTYSTISDGFFYDACREGAQQTMAGTIIFKGSNAKALYRAFADYVLNGEKLIYRYNPDGSQEYKREVKVKFLSKGECTWNYMSISASFECLTPWYTEETLTGTGSISVTVGGQLETSVKITTTSALTNPVLTMTDADGEFQRIELTLTTVSGKTLEYSNHYYDSHVYYDSSDAIRYADLTAKIFGRSRKAFTLSMTGAAMTIEVKKWWRTV